MVLPLHVALGCNCHRQGTGSIANVVKKGSLTWGATESHTLPINKRGMMELFSCLILSTFCLPNCNLLSKIYLHIISFVLWVSSEVSTMSAGQMYQGTLGQSSYFTILLNINKKKLGQGLTKSTSFFPFTGKFPIFILF